MLLEPHAGTIIWTIVTFLVVLLILRTTVWKSLLAALDERENRIRSALESAEESREEAQTLVGEYQARLDQAETEAREIVRQSRDAAEKTHQEILTQAREEAQQTVEQARLTIEREKRVAIDELRREVADLAVQGARALIQANLDDEQNRRLVDDAIARITPAESAEN